MKEADIKAELARMLKDGEIIRSPDTDETKKIRAALEEMKQLKEKKQ